MPGTKEEHTEVLDEVLALTELLDDQEKGKGDRQKLMSITGLAPLWWSREAGGPRKGQLGQVSRTDMHRPHVYKTHVQSPHNHRTRV